MIEQSTFDFLSDLNANNNREWYAASKPRFEKVKQNVEAFAEEILKYMLQTEPGLANVRGKDCVRKMHRDTRFAKDKTPFKTNLAIVLNLVGRGINGPCYYLHIEPKGCFVGGGYWKPEKEHLAAIRQELDYNGGDFEAILTDKHYAQYFQGLDEVAKLKTAPKGYPKDHPAIELLRLKSFVASRTFNEEQLMQPQAAQDVAAVFIALHPLIRFLSAAISSGKSE